MQRSRWRTGARALGLGGVAALTLLPLALTLPARAVTTAGDPATFRVDGRPDPSFAPALRRAAIAEAGRESDAAAGRLGLGDREALHVRDVLRDTDGTEHVRYDRTYAGLPVVGGDLVVADSPRGRIQVDWAHREKITVPSTQARVRGWAARSAAARRTGLAAGAAAPVKVVYAAQHRPVLAWQTTVTGTERDGTPIHDLVYTDARTNKQLARLPQVMDVQGHGRSMHSGHVSLQTVRGSSAYRLVDSLRGNHRTYNAKHSTSTRRGRLFTDADNVWGSGTTSSRQTAAVDAAYGAARTWDMYKARFGRTGIRNDGVAAYSRVHFGNSYQNAFWSNACFCMTYGDGGRLLRTLTSLDVAGHEMSHGLTTATAGLIYSGQPGGLNEATSDVMGTMVEFQAANAKDRGDYYIGEKIMKDGTYLRRMDRPSLDGRSKNCWSSSVGKLDAHYSSGVGNHLFYLLAEGTGSKTIGGRPHRSTACNGATIHGIGRNQAAAIWYRAMTAYWTSTTTYPQAAASMVRAAKDLFGATSSQCTATSRAWRAVAVTPTETCVDSTPPPVEGNLLANPGFELGRISWTATTGVITNSALGLPRSGAYFAWLAGYGKAHTDRLSQPVTIPAATTATLAFNLRVDSDEDSTEVYDTLKVQVIRGDTTTTLATYSNRDSGAGYAVRSVNLDAYMGSTVTVRFVGTEDSSGPTDFLIDDTTLLTG